MELNPNHPVTLGLHESWHKIAALIMFKYGTTKVTITSDDIERFMATKRANITMRPKGHNLTLELVTNDEARRLARKAGGIPT